MNELLEKLRRNARFYQNESIALAENFLRRDNRFLGANEAGTIASLLTEAADYVENVENLAGDRHEAERGSEADNRGHQGEP